MIGKSMNMFVFIMNAHWILMPSHRSYAATFLGVCDADLIQSVSVGHPLLVSLILQRVV